MPPAEGGGMGISMDSKKADGGYTFEQVNCVENPIKIAYGNYGKYNEIAFLLYVKMQFCYNLKKFKGIDTNKMSSLQRIEKVLEKELNVNIHRKRPLNFFKDIEQLLEMKHSVLIVGNLKELFYSNHYKKTNWIHLFLITGFDSERRIFFVIDSTQLRVNGVQNYCEFVIPYDIMYNMYESWNKYKSYEDILFFDSTEKHGKENEKDILKDFLIEFLYGKDDQPYCEISLVEKILCKETGELACERLMKIHHSKEVLFNEIDKILLICRIDKELYEMYVLRKDALLMKNREVVNRVIYLVYKNEKEKILGEVERLKVEETQMKELLHNVLMSIKEGSKQAKKNKKSDNLENNKDEIISISESGIYKFVFRGDRIYNNWQRDEAPKVICYRGNKKEEYFDIQSKVYLKYYDRYDKFSAGIFIKTDKGATYIWGINCGMSLRFEYTSVDPKKLEIFECEDSLYLQFKACGKDYYLGYSYDGLNFQKEKLDFSLDGNIIEAGLVCKTWELPKEIVIEFSDLKINKGYNEKNEGWMYDGAK